MKKITVAAVAAVTVLAVPAQADAKPRTCKSGEYASIRKLKLMVAENGGVCVPPKKRGWVRLVVLKWEGQETIELCGAMGGVAARLHEPPAVEGGFLKNPPTELRCEL